MGRGGKPAPLRDLFGVLWEDNSRHEEAIDAYQQAPADDREFADAHHNLARLHEVAGKPRNAVRHFGHPPAA